MNTSETGLEYFYFIGKLSVRLLLRALDDCLQLNLQLRIGKVICGFPGRTWSKLVKLADKVSTASREFGEKKRVKELSYCLARISAGN